MILSVKKGLFVLFAFFVWFVGTNHCAFEDIVGIPQSECPCESSGSTNDDHGHGQPCLTKSLPAQHLSFNLNDNADHADINLKVDFLVSNFFNLIEVDSKNSIIADDSNSSFTQKIYLASQAPNAPPRI